VVRKYPNSVPSGYDEGLIENEYQLFLSNAFMMDINVPVLNMQELIRFLDGDY
jgi:hypothetical protein